jgi:hypothetical protein
MGQSLVESYYKGAGKKAASFISDRLPSAIPVIRKGLDLLVKKYDANKDIEDPDSL